MKNLADFVGKKISVKGHISEIMWQHMIMRLDDYPYDYYFDLEDGYQIVLYCKEPIEIPVNKDFQVTGTVVVVEGRSKRPVDEDKEDGEIVEKEVYREYHIAVDEYSL